jgi:hypothetical protein
MIAPLHRLYERSVGAKAKEKLGVELTAALAMLFEMLQNSTPRKVQLRATRPSVILYTDGAVEQGEATCGGIIFPPGGKAEFFSLRIPDEWTKAWSDSGTRHAVAQAEAFPVLVAKLTWAKYLQNAQVLLFTDNEVIRAGLIKGHSANLSTYDILNAIGAEDYKADAVQWVARVPSASNPADAPSRMSRAEVIEQFGAIEVQPSLPKISPSGRAMLLSSKAAGA